MNKQMIDFKSHLETFAVKYKKEITLNPVFRNQFLKMCKEIGVDPLSCNHFTILLKCHVAKKGFWVDVLGVGDFYYELAVKDYTLKFYIDLNSEYMYRFKKEKWRFSRRK